jgi:hypothetical protein
VDHAAAADRRSTGPSGDEWSSVVKCGPQDTLTTPALPGFAIRLAEID